MQTYKQKVPSSSRLLSTEWEGLNLAVFIKGYQGAWASLIESVDFTYMAIFSILFRLHAN